MGKIIPLFDEHDFWHSQPVPKYFEALPLSQYDQPVERKALSEVQQEPYGLPPGYHWVNLNLAEEDDLNELYTLLKNHYVEDSDGKFRFDYSTEFLRWALSPPNNKPDWLVGVRAGTSKKLFGFISAIPVSMTVNGADIPMAEVNFLCVHKKLREKRLAPLLIKEVTRRVNTYDIWQAIYTSGVTLPTPFATAPYFHRNLNPKKLVEVNFSYKPANQTMAQFVKLHKLPKDTTTQGLKPMTEADVAKVTVALNAHLAANYKAHIKFSEEEVSHFFLPTDKVIWSYLVEDDSGAVSDFISFYALNSQILNDENHTHIYAAYCFYNFVKDNDGDRMKALIRDLLVLARNAEFDVVNMTQVMQHGQVKEELMFKPGDGRLAHYFYNWRMQSIQPGDIGICLV